MAVAPLAASGPGAQLFDALVIIVLPSAASAGLSFQQITRSNSFSLLESSLSLGPGPVVHWQDCERQIAVTAVLQAGWARGQGRAWALTSAPRPAPPGEITAPPGEIIAPRAQGRPSAHGRKREPEGGREGGRAGEGGLIWEGHRCGAPTPRGGVPCIAERGLARSVHARSGAGMLSSLFPSVVSAL